MSVILRLLKSQNSQDINKMELEKTPYQSVKDFGISVNRIFNTNDKTQLVTLKAIVESCEELTTIYDRKKFKSPSEQLNNDLEKQINELEILLRSTLSPHREILKKSLNEISLINLVANSYFNFCHEKQNAINELKKLRQTDPKAYEEALRSLQEEKGETTAEAVDVLTKLNPNDKPTLENQVNTQYFVAAQSLENENGDLTTIDYTQKKS